MKHKGAIIAILLCVAFLGLSVAIVKGVTAWMFQDPTTEIKKGFSPELIQELKEHYGITVPANAVFIKGYNTNARDPEIIVWFECQIDELPEGEGGDLVCRLLELEEDSYSSQAWRAEKHSNELYNEMGEFDYQINYKKKSDTYINYKFDQGKIIIRFVGWKPPLQFP